MFKTEQLFCGAFTSYHRFKYALQFLQGCKTALEENDISSDPDEPGYRAQLIALCAEIADSVGGPP